MNVLRERFMHSNTGKTGRFPAFIKPRSESAVYDVPNGLY
jgi:hypothetical protein